MPVETVKDNFGDKLAVGTRVLAEDGLWATVVSVNDHGYRANNWATSTDGIYIPIQYDEPSSNNRPRYNGLKYRVHIKRVCPPRICLFEWLDGRVAVS